MWTEVYGAAVETTWAIVPASLQQMLATVRAGELEDQAARRKLPKVSGAVAVLPLHGVISQRSSIWQQLFGGTATEQFGAAFTRAVNDDRIKAVIIDTDSPGGTVAGVQTLADAMYQGSQAKPVAAIANSQAASAAYWLASQVGHGKQALVAAPGAEVGSIGVFRMHQDVSEALAQDGIKVTMLSVPEYKTEGNPFEPLSEKAREFHMGQVESTYSVFVDAVARGRGVTKSVVRNQFGRGRMYHADQAADANMVDRVASLPQLLAELGVSDSVGGLSASEVQQVQDELCHAWETCDSGLMAATEKTAPHSVFMQRLRLREKRG